MRGTQLAEVHGFDDAGVTAALELVTAFDDAFVTGFARLNEERVGALTALSGAMAVTPLGERVAEAVDKVAAGSIADEHLVALAAARSALLGSVHDALVAGVDKALGRERAAYAAAPVAGGEEHLNLLAGSRSWLRELAIAGWRGVDHDLVSAVGQTVTALLALPTESGPSRRRLAVLLDGLAAELRAASPIATMDKLPKRRWADLWCRALLLSQPGQGEPVAAPVSGRLLVLGADVHEHATAVQVQVHGVLETGEGARLVRASVSAAKVDTIVGRAVWKLLAQHTMLTQALAKRVSLTLTDMPLLPSGDLVWHDDRARPGEPADPFTTAKTMLSAAVAPATPPLQRHPIGIAEPVLLEHYSVENDLLHRDGGPEEGVRLALERLPSSGPLTADLVRKSNACVGLLRWDAGVWSVQPLAIRVESKKGDVEYHNGDWALGHPDPKVVKADAKDDAVGTLRERAGRLLRK
jgi:hypothetical protein